MITVGTRLKAVDNSGADIVECIGINGPTGLRYAYSGDIILVSVKTCSPSGKVKKGKIYAAVIVQTVYTTVREDGGKVRFDQNAAVLLDRKTHEMIGTRVVSPIAREARIGYPPVASLAPDVY